MLRSMNGKMDNPLFRHAGLRRLDDGPDVHRAHPFEAREMAATLGLRSGWNDN